MAGVAEAELERLLTAAAHDPAARPVFTATLLESEVYVLGTLDGVALHLVALEDDQGLVTPFFTSAQALRALLDARPATDDRYLRLPCRIFFKKSRGARLVLNPYGPFGKSFSAAEVTALID